MIAIGNMSTYIYWVHKTTTWSIAITNQPRLTHGAERISQSMTHGVPPSTVSRGNGDLIKAEGGFRSGSMCGSTNDNGNPWLALWLYEYLDQLPSLVLWKTRGLCFGNVSSQSGLLIKYFQILQTRKSTDNSENKITVSHKLVWQVFMVCKRVGKSTLQRHKPSFIFHKVRWLCSWRGGALQQDFRVRKLVKRGCYIGPIWHPIWQHVMCLW